jgi:hypothetical protein
MKPPPAEECSRMTWRDGQGPQVLTVSDRVEWKGSRAFDMADNEPITRAAPRSHRVAEIDA